MKPLLIIAALALAGSAFAAADRAEDPAGNGLNWTVAPTGKAPADRVQLRRHGLSTTIDLAELPQLAVAVVADTVAPVAFERHAEAGMVSCTGSAGKGEGSGTCRFFAHDSFAKALKARGIAVGSSSDSLAMALVDARIASVDELVRAGLAPRDGDAVIAASALKVTGAYLAELKAAGLRLASVDELVACRALDVDGAWLRELASAGYASLTAREAIEMRAVGITGSYARAMNRIAEAGSGFEGSGGLQ